MSLKKLLLFSTLSALCFGLRPVGASAMEFLIVPFGGAPNCGTNCPEVVSAVGEITGDTPQQFFAFLKSHFQDGRLRSIVLLNSPGGSVAGSMRLGMMFRKTGVASVVASAAGGGVGPGGCYSACVYAFMGGKKRVVPPLSRLGIHRMSFEEWERDLSTLEYKERRHYGTPEIVGQLSNYANYMGISRDLIATAETISPDTIHIVSPEEMRRWRLGSTKF